MVTSVMVLAFVMISCDLGHEKNIVDNLKSLILVTKVEETVGAYDIVATIESNSSEKVKDAVSSKIRKMENVRSTLTLFSN